MSGSVSPLPWTGNKGCIYTTIDAFMPPHRTYVEACMGSAEVFLRKKPVCIFINSDADQPEDCRDQRNHSETE